MTQFPDAQTVARALAITAVVVIHFLAGLPSDTYTTASYQPLVVALDQLCRLSVPIFVALSGWGLMEKYSKKRFTWPEFVRRRVWKLLPLYLIWSLIFWISFQIVPAWRPQDTPSSLVTQLLLGRADYQLYFVPMIFQLYLLFPFLRQVVQRQPWVVLGATLAFQGFLYWGMTRPEFDLALFSQLETDQEQYGWFFTWIGYFVLGMCLPLILPQIQKNRLWLVGAVSASIVAWWWATKLGVASIAGGVDPIIALRFTRPVILVFASFGILGLVGWLSIIKTVTGVPGRVLGVLGKHSYLIYLSHTLFLRIFFTIFRF